VLYKNQRLVKVRTSELDDQPAGQPGTGGIAMMKKRRLKLTAIAVSLFGFCCVASTQEKPPVPVRSWDLNVDTDYAARMAKKLRTITLKSPTIVFLDNQKLAVTYQDGKGASPSDGTILIPGAKQLPSREKAESPLYKLHALIFDANIGPGAAKHLEWDAIREEAQLLPAHDAGFAVRVDNKFLVYSNDSQLQNKMILDYESNEALSTRGSRVSESYIAAVSLSGRSLAICHMLPGSHGGGSRVTLYEINTLKQIGQTSEINNVGGCRFSFNVTDQAIYVGPYVVHPDAPAWQKINPWCMQCNAPVPAGNKLMYFWLLDENHVLTWGNDYEVLDFKGHEYYVTSHKKDVGVAGPVRATNAPRIAYSDGQSKEESGHRWSTHLYVVDWKERRKIAALKFVQNALPAVHDGGLQLEALGVTDFSYALSPDGKELAVLSMNSLKIYDLP
jgi:hypothetical protein